MNHHTQTETVLVEKEKSFFSEFAMYGVGLALVFLFVLMVTA
jgi:hypothetical protein